MRIVTGIGKLFISIIISAIGISCSDGIADDSVSVETATSISFTLTISPDLLKFVTPQVSYVDENGTLVTITGVDELDGKAIENDVELNSGGVSFGSWTSLTITGTGFKCWTLNMKFKRMNFHSYMGVKYLRNSFVEETSGKVYDFHHSINTSVNAVKVTTTTKDGLTTMDDQTYIDHYVSLTFFDYHTGDSVEDYLQQLSTTPDKAGYFVTSNGDVFRNDDFSL